MSKRHVVIDGPLWKDPILRLVALFLLVCVLVTMWALVLVREVDDPVTDDPFPRDTTTGVAWNPGG